MYRSGNIDALRSNISLSRGDNYGLPNTFLNQLQCHCWSAVASHSCTAASDAATCLKYSKSTTLLNCNGFLKQHCRFYIVQVAALINPWRSHSHCPAFCCLAFFIIFGYASEDTVLRLSVSNIISSINQQNPCSKILKWTGIIIGCLITYCHCFLA